MRNLLAEIDGHYDIHIRKFDDVFMNIECSRGIAQEIRDHFSFYAHNYKFMPLYKNRMWDGKIYLFRDGKLYLGLLDRLLEFARENHYTINNLQEPQRDPDFDIPGFIENLNLPFPPRDYQVESLRQTIRNKRILILSSTGCHGKGDRVLMANGEWKNIEDISIGESITGMDGKPKRVLRLFNGYDELYEVDPKNNREKITVTKDHLLPLKVCNGEDCIKYISVEDYINTSKNFKKGSSLIYNSSEVVYDEKPVDCKLSPYFIGVYLGDGHTHACRVTNIDPEIIDSLYEEAGRFNCEVNLCDDITYSLRRTSGKTNPILQEFNKIGLVFGNKPDRVSCENKYIPKELLTTPINYRLELLAGLIDTDGGLEHHTSYAITSKSKSLIDSIEVLCISLGLIVTKSTKYDKRYDRDYYVIRIMGDIQKIPTRIARKRLVKQDSGKDYYKCGFNVTSIGPSEYFGIEVEDNLYITNGGMITHNSGKTYSLYLILRYLQRFKKKGILLVPTVSLVTQSIKDFGKYGWDTEKFCHQIFSGKEKSTDKFLSVSTWQSVYKLPRSHFSQFDFMIVDECHLAKGKSLSGIGEKCCNADYRIGTTGTLDGTEVNQMTLEGLFGGIFTATSTSKLMERGDLSKLKIKCIVLKHPDGFCKDMRGRDYQEEMNYLVSSGSRNNFIKNLAGSLEGNTLVLFQYVEKHGDVLYKILQGTGKKVLYVHGDISADIREEIREITERESGIIILASYGVYSTGVSINNLDNIIFASSSKSRIRNLQSIGRGLRLNEGKEYATLYDISDDLRWKSYTNHTLKHLQERVKIYGGEKFDYKIYEVPLKDS